MELSINSKYVRILSLLYLALPFFIFFFGWLKPIYAIPMCLLLLYSLVKYIMTIQGSSIKISYFQVFLFVAVLVLWHLLSGMGGFGYQNPDYPKHIAFYKDLMTRPWPLHYTIEGKEYYLVNYMAYYLVPPTFLGNLVSWKAEMLLMYLWGTLGAGLGVFWFCRLVGRFSLMTYVYFILSSGTHLFGLFITNRWKLGQMIVDAIKNQGAFFEGNVFGVFRMDYLSFTDIHFRSPQHSIPAWLFTGLILNDWLKEKDIRYLPFYVALSYFWSPMVCLGLIPIMLFIVFKEKLAGIFNAVNLLSGTLIFLVTYLYMSSLNVEGMPHHFIFFHTNYGFPKEFAVYLFFMFFEVFIFWIPAYYVILKTPSLQQFKSLAILAGVLLSLIPLYRLGLFNDFCSKVSLPALYILWMLVLIAFYHIANKLFKISLLLLMLIASFDPLVRLGVSFHFTHNRFKWNVPVYKDVPDMAEAHRINLWPYNQIFAEPNSFFFKHLAKEADK